MIEYTFVDDPVEDYQYYLTKEMYFKNQNAKKSFYSFHFFP